MIHLLPDIVNIKLKEKRRNDLLTHAREHTQTQTRTQKEIIVVALRTLMEIASTWDHRQRHPTVTHAVHIFLLESEVVSH